MLIVFLCCSTRFAFYSVFDSHIRVRRFKFSFYILFEFILVLKENALQCCSLSIQFLLVRILHNSNNEFNDLIVTVK